MARCTIFTKPCFFFILKGCSSLYRKSLGFASFGRSSGAFLSAGLCFVFISARYLHPSSCSWKRRQGEAKSPLPWSHGSSWQLRPCQSIHYKLLSTLIVFRKILANGKFRKFGVLVFGFCERLFSELLEIAGGGEYGQEEGQEEELRKGLVLVRRVQRGQGWREACHPKPGVSGSLGWRAVVR